MKKIKKFNEFKVESVLYIFDFDDTLVETPEFEELAIEYLKEDVTISDLLRKCTDEIGISDNQLKWQDNRIYFEDPQSNFDISPNSKYWVRKGNRVYLLSPNEFSLSDMSLPSETKELKELYNSVENKCIVTARPEIIRNKIINSLKSLGFQDPKFGLHMYPHLNHRNAGEWKGHKIVEILNDTGFKSAIFYDDNPRYIKKARKVIDQELPEFDIKYVKVQK
jgi:hypothetical protein